MRTVHKTKRIPAFSESNDITFLELEARRAVSSDVLVTLFVTVVLRDVVKVILSDNDSTVHFGGGDDTLNDTTTDGDVASEGALLINVLALDSASGGLEAQTDVLVVALVLTLLLDVRRINLW